MQLPLFNFYKVYDIFFFCVQNKIAILDVITGSYLITTQTHNRFLYNKSKHKKALNERKGYNKKFKDGVDLFNTFLKHL